MSAPAPAAAHPDADMVAAEFGPDFVPTLPSRIPFFMHCQAWRNDTWPQWMQDATSDDTLALGIDYLDPAEREFPDMGGRFSVYMRCDTNVTLYDGDDWNAARIALWAAYLGHAFRLDATGADYIDNRTSARAMTDEQAAQYDADLDDAYKTCNVAAIARNAWKAIGLEDINP